MHSLLLMCVLVLGAKAFPPPQSACGADERGVLRQPGDSWQEAATGAAAWLLADLAALESFVETSPVLVRVCSSHVLPVLEHFNSSHVCS